MTKVDTVAFITSFLRESDKNHLQANSKSGSINSLNSIKRILINLEAIGIKESFIITNNFNLKNDIDMQGVEIVCNDAVSSRSLLRSTLKQLDESIQFILLVPDSVPLFSANSAQQVLDSSAELAIPVYNNVAGHPMKISRQLFENTLQNKNRDGLKQEIEKNNIKIDRISVYDRGVVFRSKDNQDYEKLLNFRDYGILRPQVKVQIVKEKPFFGPGLRRLLTAIDQGRTLRGACEHIDLSYSKGRNMIKTMERQLGYAAIETQQGGEKGGSSKLTPAGKRFLEQYIQYEKDVKQYASKKFMEFFRE